MEELVEGMNMYQTTERLILQVLPPYYCQQVLDFYVENKMHFEPWEAARQGGDTHDATDQGSILSAAVRTVLPE